MADTYHEFRTQMWEPLWATMFDPRGSTFKKGGRDVPLPADQCVLVPKTIHQYKDVWHCGSLERAKQLAITVLGFSDTRDIELRGRWLWVEWDHTGKRHLLEGQVTDNRVVYRGRR